jgi:hypothetical protein
MTLKIPAKINLSISSVLSRPLMFGGKSEMLGDGNFRNPALAGDLGI